LACLIRPFYFSVILTTAVLICTAGTALSQTPDAKAKGAGSISGRVTVGGKSAAGVAVAAFGGDIYPRRTAAQTTTDAEGRYRLFGLAAATYQVTALTPTFVTPGPNENYPYNPGKTIFLSAGEAAEDVDFKLVRGVVITGRVTDEDGKPVIEERINLEAVGPMQMAPYFNGPMYQTDDRGIYRIYGLPVGRYRVSAGRDNNGFGVMGSRGGFQQTFYGDTSDPTKAVILELGEGSEASNIDIHLGHRGSMFSVTGRVVDSETGEPVAGTRLTYGRISPTNPMSGAFFSGLPTNVRGEFRFDGLEPGRYSLYVSARGDGGNYYSKPIVFEIVDRNVTDLELKALQGLTLSGVVVLESDSGKSTLSQLGSLRIAVSVRTISNPPTNNSGSALVSADGSFMISGLAPGTANLYLYSAQNPNRRFSSTRIELDGVDKTLGINLQEGQSISNLRVLVRYGTGVIRGTIKLENGSPPPGARSFVSLLRDGRSANIGTSIDARGRFRITDIPPGNYEVILNLGFPIPSLQPTPGPRPLMKQFVTVSNDTEVEVNFTVDLKPKEGGP
jgi:hypothetical protein